MTKRELDAFVSTLMVRVRDRAIEECDWLADSARSGVDASSPRIRMWSTALGSADPTLAIKKLIPAIVDETLFSLLLAMDDGGLPLAWLAPDGSATPFTELGDNEMAGWLVGDDGWRERFSSQRIAEPDAGADRGDAGL